MAQGSTIGNFFKGLGNLFSAWLFSTNDLIYKSAVSITGIEDAFNDMAEKLRLSVEEIKSFGHFDFEPHWKTRVISLPKAWEGIQELTDIILHSLGEKFSELRTSAITLTNTIKMDIAPARTGDEGPSKLGDLETKFASLTIAVNQFRDVFNEAVDLVDTLADLKDRMETLDDIFLPQTKGRKFLTERTYKRISP